MVAVQVGDEDGIDPLRHLARRRGRVPAQVQEPVAQDRVREQPDTTELDQDGRVSDEGKTILRRTGRHCLTPYG